VLDHEDIVASPRGRGRPRKNPGQRDVRGKLLDATRQLVARIGPTDANATQVAAAIGAKPSSVNYHFGSFAALVAAAGIVEYEDYANHRWERVWALVPDPDVRLREFVLSQQEWAKAKPGWAAFFNFPPSAQKASEIMFAQYGDQMRALFELSYARFYRLAKDVSEGEVYPDPDWAEKADPAEILADTRLLSEVVVLGWIGLGMTVWGARNQDEKFGGAQVSRYNELAREHALETTMERLKSRGV
jgi:AcrR family transcriptional regulator